MEQRYILRKLVMAKSVEEAIKKDKRSQISDVFVDEEWLKLQDKKIEMGFKDRVK